MRDVEPASCWLSRQKSMIASKMLALHSQESLENLSNKENKDGEDNV